MKKLRNPPCKRCGKRGAKDGEKCNRCHNLVRFSKPHKNGLGKSPGNNVSQTPPPSVDPGRKARLEGLQALAGKGLPLFAEAGCRVERQARAQMDREDAR